MVARALSEYEVEDILIKRLVDINYDFIKMTNYDDLKSNLREQICKVNAEKLIEAKGEAMLSDAEFSRILIHLEGHTVYDSARILREQYVLELDNGEKVYINFLTCDYTRNAYQVTHQVTMDKEHCDDVD